MKQVHIKYKSGNVVKVNYTDKVNVKYKNEQLTKISIEGMVGGAHPLFYGFPEVESVSVVSIGWQRVAEYLLNIPGRLWRAVIGVNNGRT